MPDEIKDLIASLDFDWKRETPKKLSKDKWEALTVIYPAGAKDVIREEFERIGKLLEVNPKVNTKVKNGLILEMICVLSSLTPTQSLE